MTKKEPYRMTTIACRAVAHSPLVRRIIGVTICVTWFVCPAGAQPTDAVSREISVFNDLANPVAIAEIHSRELTVFNNLLTPIDVNDTISRELSVFNDLINPLVFVDAISREFTARNVFRCTGNLTDDGFVTMADVTPFVDVLVGAIHDDYLSQAADMNCDGKTAGMDIKLFVEQLLT